jgi:ferredoxin
VTISEQKTLEEILGYLEGERKVFLIGCTECAATCLVGGEPQLIEFKQQLENNGKQVTGYLLGDPGCHVPELKRLLRQHKEAVEAADGVLVLSCGTGTQAAAQALPEKKVHPGANTKFLGSVQRFGNFEEYCSACGECIIDLTRGICPVTRCSKGLLNGPCGGTTAEGKCEVDAEKDCAWMLIYKRLSQSGELDRLRAFQPVKKTFPKPGKHVVERKGAPA